MFYVALGIAFLVGFACAILAIDFSVIEKEEGHGKPIIPKWNSWQS